MTGFIVYYIQLVGQVQLAEHFRVQEEMYKAFSQFQARYKREERQLHTYLVYEESFQKWLQETGQALTWSNSWELPLYSDYHQKDNLKLLLQQIPHKEWPSKAYVLGSGMGMKEWLPWIAPHVQSIELYVEFLTKGLEMLREELCEEYGMITDLKLVAPGEFPKERLRSKERILVIDFSGQQKLSVLGLARGSIWVDMDSSEEKRHLIEDRPTGVKYLSLNTIWQREMQETLDTISKFAYNT